MGLYHTKNLFAQKEKSTKWNAICWIGENTIKYVSDKLIFKIPTELIKLNCKKKKTDNLWTLSNHLLGVF